MAYSIPVTSSQTRGPRPEASYAGPQQYSLSAASMTNSQNRGPRPDASYVAPQQYNQSAASVTNSQTRGPRPEASYAAPQQYMSAASGPSRDAILSGQTLNLGERDYHSPRYEEGGNHIQRQPSTSASQFPVPTPRFTSASQQAADNANRQYSTTIPPSSGMYPLPL